MDPTPPLVLRTGHQYHPVGPSTARGAAPTTIPSVERPWALGGWASARMISLFPRPLDEPFDPAEAVPTEERPSPEERPWVMTNMIASADGATAVDGVSGALGGSADKAMFMALRSVTDGILVGASTVRQERYRPPSAGDEATGAARAARGQQVRPLLVVVTGSLNLDPELPLFADASYRPLIITVESAPAEQRRRLAAVADVIDVGERRVELPEALAVLRRRQVSVLLSEGGPSLNGQLIADDLIDEWNLSLAPLLAAGSSSRPARGPEPVGPPAKMALSRVWEQDQLLFCRWIRSARQA